MTPDRSTSVDPPRLICQRCNNRAASLDEHGRCEQCVEDLRSQDEFLKQSGPGKLEGKE